MAQPMDETGSLDPDPIVPTVDEEKRGYLMRTRVTQALCTRDDWVTALTYLHHAKVAGFLGSFAEEAIQSQVPLETLVAQATSIDLMTLVMGRYALDLCRSASDLHSVYGQYFANQPAAFFGFANDPILDTLFAVGRFIHKPANPRWWIDPADYQRLRPSTALIVDFYRSRHLVGHRMSTTESWHIYFDKTLAALIFCLDAHARYEAVTHVDQLADLDTELQKECEKIVLQGAGHVDALVLDAIGHVDPWVLDHFPLYLPTPTLGYKVIVAVHQTKLELLQYYIDRGFIFTRIPFERCNLIGTVAMAHTRASTRVEVLDFMLRHGLTLHGYTEPQPTDKTRREALRACAVRASGPELIAWMMAHQLWDPFRDVDFRTWAAECDPSNLEYLYNQGITVDQEQLAQFITHRSLYWMATFRLKPYLLFYRPQEDREGQRYSYVYNAFQRYHGIIGPSRDINEEALHDHVAEALEALHEMRPVTGPAYNLRSRMRQLMDPSGRTS